MTEKINNIQEKLNQKIDGLFDDFDALLEKPNADQERLIEQALRIVALLMKSSRKLNRNYWLDREKDLQQQVKKIQATYNSPKVLALTIASGAITILGSAGGALVAVPALSGYKSIIEIISKSTGAGGQFLGSASGIANNSDTALRTKEDAELQLLKEKRHDRLDAAREEERQAQDAIRKAQELEDNF